MGEAGGAEAGAAEAGGGGGGGAGAAEEGQTGQRSAAPPPAPDAAAPRAAPPAPANEPTSPGDQPAAQQGRDAPPAGGRGAAGAAASLAGWWEVTNTGDAPGGEGRAVRSYRVALRQEGARVSGEGEEWEEGGHPLGAGARTRIELSGSIAGREVRLHFTERGPAGTMSGTITWRLASSGDDLSGTFSSASTDAHGASSAVRLQ